MILDLPTDGTLPRGEKSFRYQIFFSHLQCSNITSHNDVSNG